MTLENLTDAEHQAGASTGAVDLQLLLEALKPPSTTQVAQLIGKLTTERDDARAWAALWKRAAKRARDIAITALRTATGREERLGQELASGDKALNDARHWDKHNAIPSIQVRIMRLAKERDAARAALAAVEKAVTECLRAIKAGELSDGDYQQQFGQAFVDMLEAALGQEDDSE